jgi:CheY-like chemotaxis protein
MARILVIDDDQAVRLTIQLVLERAGHEVTLADGGRQGVQLFGDDDFDLLIVDIFMPGMDGLETMRDIHRLRPAVPVVVISGYAFRTPVETVPDFLKMAEKLGAVRTLRKPFRPAELLSIVGDALDRSGDTAQVSEAG